MEISVERTSPVISYELEQIARALHREINGAQKRLDGLHRDLRLLQRSARHPKKGRLSELQSASSEQLELLGLLEGTVSKERELHERFAVHWLSGEWFARHEDILTYFTEHGIVL